MDVIRINERGLAVENIAAGSVNVKTVDSIAMEWYRNQA